MNIFELITDAIKPYLDGEKSPLNVGEVMNLWFYLTATEQTLRGEQVSFNTVEDQELKEKLKDVMHDVHEPIRTEVVDFLKAEGVPLPKMTPDHTIGEFRDIPKDGKLNDQEVANLVSFNIVLGINYATRGMTESVRPDVAAMFARFQLKKTLFMIPFRDLLKRKGWLMIPPYYQQQELSQETVVTT
jgi:hypothetical protein